MEVGVGFGGTSMSILSKNIGGDKPQYPVAKSIHFRHSARCWPCLQAMKRREWTMSWTNPSD
jgi:hypothetical protein